MSEAVRIAAKPTARPRVRVSLSAVAVGGLALGAGAYYAVCGLLIHLSFHSYGWDLGIFDQVLWSIAHGHGFHYSFRDMWYLGDHFQPMLVLLAPMVFLRLGAAPILVVQGMAFGAAVVPLHWAVRRIAGGTPRAVPADGSPHPHQEKEISGDTPAPPAEGAAPPLHSPLAAKTRAAVETGTARALAAETRGMVAAWGLSVAYVVSLGAARAVSFDFHPECLVPVLAFTALWGLAAQRPGVFVAATLALLPIKEDVSLLVLGLCWVAWLGFGQRRPAKWIALGSIAYFLVVSLAVIPLIAHGNSNPLVERYPYLGGSASSIFFHALTRPDLIVDHLWNGDTPRTLLYLFAGTGFLALLRPKLLLPIVLLLVPPLLAENGQQQRLELHYGVVPYTFTFVAAAMVLEAGYLASIFGRPAPPHPKEKRELGDTPRPPAEEGFAPSALPLIGRLASWRWLTGRRQSAGTEEGDRRGVVARRPAWVHPARPNPKEKEALGDTPRPPAEGHRHSALPLLVRLLNRHRGGEAGEVVGSGKSGTAEVAASVPSPPPLSQFLGEGRSVVLSLAVALMAVGMFVWKSPLPPSFAANVDQFRVDHHSDVAETFVDMVPGDAIVSAQASFVPHLSERHDIFEFPRITPRATYVLVDANRYVPGYDAPAYDSCRAKLPAFGFAVVREEDGIELWVRSEGDAGRLGSEGCG